MRKVFWFAGFFPKPFATRSFSHVFFFFKETPKCYLFSRCKDHVPPAFRPPASFNDSSLSCFSRTTNQLVVVTLCNLEPLAGRTLFSFFPPTWNFTHTAPVFCVPFMPPLCGLCPFILQLGLYPYGVPSSNSCKTFPSFFLSAVYRISVVRVSFRDDFPPTSF